MTPAEYRALRKSIASQQKVAAELGVDYRTSNAARLARLKLPARPRLLCVPWCVQKTAVRELNHLLETLSYGAVASFPRLGDRPLGCTPRPLDVGLRFGFKPSHLCGGGVR